MKNRECDIIKDLLPSYVDEICSEASKEWVEEHLKTCEECKTTAKLLAATELSSKELDMKQLDAGKKVKQKTLRSSMVNLGLCLFLVFLMVLVFDRKNLQVSQMVLYIALPICMIMTWFVNRNQKTKRGWDKWDTMSVIAVVLAIAYGAGMMLYVGLKSLAGLPVFALELSEIGPFLYLQMMVSAIICFVLYVIQMVRMLRQGSTNSVILNLSLTGIFLMLVYCVFMGQLSDTALAAEQLKKATVTVLDVGLVSTASLAMLDKFVNQ